jgi:hypothetical protein
MTVAGRLFQSGRVRNPAPRRNNQNLVPESGPSTHAIDPWLTVALAESRHLRAPRDARTSYKPSLLRQPPSQ